MKRVPQSLIFGTLGLEDIPQLSSALVSGISKHTPRSAKFKFGENLTFRDFGVKKVTNSIFTFLDQVAKIWNSFEYGGTICLDAKDYQIRASNSS
jgi:hypothetical protein